MIENCTDIGGNDISQFLFGEDGVVYGVLDYQDVQTNYDITLPYSGDGTLVHLSIQCCTVLGQTYDSNYGRCYHNVPTEADLKIVFNVNGHNGLVFSQTGIEQCHLNLKFDYLVEYASELLYNRAETYGDKISELLSGLELSLLVEKYVTQEPTDGTLIENSKTLVTVHQQPLYNIEGFGGSSGIILTGIRKTEVNNILKSELGFAYNAELLDSPWLHANIDIIDPAVIQEIIGQEVKFSILVTNNDVEFSLIMDNIVMDKICVKEWIDTRPVDSAPSFNVIKTIDNKKSWVSGQPQRDYTMPIRETSYGTADERMVINSKEVEISTSIHDAIEQDIAQFIVDNTGLLDGTNDGDYTTLNVTEMMSTDIMNLPTHHLILQAMATELVDVKSRKTLVNYPLLGLIYDRYLTSELYLNGVHSNKYTPTKLNGLVTMLGGYWADLIEQVVPSTTIWASINRVGTTTFIPNKYTYKRYNIICGDIDWGIQTDMNGNEVEVISGDTELQVCSNIQIATFSDSGTTIGTVSVTGGDGTNNTTTINEG